MTVGLVIPTATTPSANAGIQTLKYCGISFNRDYPVSDTSFTYELKYALGYDASISYATTANNVQFPNAAGGVMTSPHTTLLGSADTTGGLEIYYNTVYLPNGQILIFMGRSGGWFYFTNPSWEFPEFTQAQGSSRYIHVAVVRDASRKLSVWFDGVAATQSGTTVSPGSPTYSSVSYQTDNNNYTNVRYFGTSGTFTSDVNPKQYVSNLRLVTGAALYNPTVSNISIPSTADLRLNAPSGTTQVLLNSMTPSGILANSSNVNNTAAVLYNFGGGSQAQIDAGEACSADTSKAFVGGDGVYNVYFADGSTTSDSGNLPNREYYDSTASPHTAITIPANTMTKSGYAFAGWNTESNGSGTTYLPGSSYTPTGNSTLYTKWVASYAVTFANGGGTGTLPTQSALATGASFTLPANPFTKANSVFSAWTDGSSTYAAGATYTMGTGAKTITAQWVTGYKATFNANSATSGTVPATQEYANPGGTALTIASNTGNLLRTGYTFAGWNNQANGLGTTSYSEGQSGVTLSADVTLYAKWTANTYTATYDSNNATSGTAPTSQSYTTAGTALTLPGNSGTLARTGYTFAGWNTSADGSGTSYTASQAGVTFTANRTLFAKWTANSNVVAYDSQSGSAVSNGSFVTGSTLTLPAAPTRAGYTFAGWFAESTGGTALVSGYSPSETGAITVYAQWTANTYTISYDANSATSGSAPASQSYTSGSTALTLDDNSATPLLRTGYTFAGWNTAANGGGTNYLAGATSQVFVANTTLYAKWTGNSNVITFDSQGGSTQVQVSFTTGNTVTMPGASSRAGYTFASWNTAANGSGTNYTAGQTGITLAGDTTLYAKWTANSFNATFNTQGGSAVSAISFTTGGTLTLPADPTRTGYTFNGWFAATSGGIALVSGYSPSNTSAFTLYAQWTGVGYQLTFDANNSTSGAVPASQSYVTGGSALTLPGNSGTLVRTGYSFTGWATVANGTGTTYTAAQTGVTLLADTILYANWIAKSIRTLSFSTLAYNKSYGETLTVTAALSTGTGTITYSRGTSTACTVNANTGLVTITSGIGRCAVSASAPEDLIYQATETASSVVITVSKSLPAMPTLGLVTSVNGVLTVAFTQSDFVGNGITDYKYSIDGINFISVGNTTSPLSIPGLIPGTYTLQILAVNSLGDGTPTAPVTVIVIAGPTVTVTTSGGGGGGGFIPSGPSASEIAAETKAAVAKALADKAAADKVIADKAAADKAIADRLAADKAGADKAIADRLAADKAAADKAIADKLNADKIAAEKALADKLAIEKAAADKLAADNSAAAAQFKSTCNLAKGPTAVTSKSSAMKIYSQVCFVPDLMKPLEKDLMQIKSVVNQIKSKKITAITLSSFADEKSGVNFKSVAQTRADVVAAMIKKANPKIKITYRLFGSSTKKNSLSLGRVVISA